MAQTTGAVAQACGKVWYSTVGGGGPWTDISGQTSKVTPDPQTRNTGEAYTFTGSTAITKAGKRTPFNITFDIIYTESAAEAYKVVMTQFAGDCSGIIYMRWAPAGGEAGEDHISTGPAEIVSMPLPGMDASAGGPIMVSFVIRCTDVYTVAETT